jgi:hypothetical protein
MEEVPDPNLWWLWDAMDEKAEAVLEMRASAAALSHHLTHLKELKWRNCVQGVDVRTNSPAAWKLVKDFMPRVGVDGRVPTFALESGAVTSSPREAVEAIARQHEGVSAERKASPDQSAGDRTLNRKMRRQLTRWMRSRRGFTHLGEHFTMPELNAVLATGGQEPRRDTTSGLTRCWPRLGCTSRRLY